MAIALIVQCRICERDFAPPKSGVDLCSDCCRNRASYEKRLQADYIEITDRLMVAVSAGESRGKVENLAMRRVELEAALGTATPRWLREFKFGPLP